MKPSNVAKALATLVAARRPAYLHGQPGVGKTSIVEQVAAALEWPEAPRSAAAVAAATTIARKRGWRLIVSRLALMESVDLRGLPVVENGTTRWLCPNDFPQEGCDPTIWFFDEWAQAMPSVQNAAGQLLNERRLGDYVLPDNVVIVAAGNRAKDRAATNKLPSHIADRFVHLDVEVDLEDWTKWALNAGVATEVVAFLRFRPELLSQFDPSKDVSPTPRSWQYVSEIRHQNPPAEIELDLYGGTVGQGPATEFVAFMRVFRSLPTFEQIILNPDTAKLPQEPAALYAVSTLIARKATSTNFDAVIQYARRMSPEFQVLTVKQVMARDPSMQNTRTFIQWASDNADVIL